MRRKTIKLSILTCVLLLAGTLTGFAQQSVKGKVLDEKTGDPLIGVSVTVQGTSQGTITDFDGNFQLILRKEETLQLTYIGYLPQTIVLHDS